MEVNRKWVRVKRGRSTQRTRNEESSPRACLFLSALGGGVTERVEEEKRKHRGKNRNNCFPEKTGIP